MHVKLRMVDVITMLFVHMIQQVMQSSVLARLDIPILGRMIRLTVLVSFLIRKDVALAF